MLYDLKIPKEKGYFDLIVETKHKHDLKELKELLYKTNIDEDLKDDISFTNDFTILNYNMKFFFIRNGFKVIDLSPKEEI